MKLAFLTGTRADWGKLRPLIEASKGVADVTVFATGMHMDPLYGYTITEVHKANLGVDVVGHVNGAGEGRLASVAAATMYGLEAFVRSHSPDLLVIHGDRAEALAGASVGALNNVRVAHVEGGELSGTVDESLRHAISKLAHVHFVADEGARRRLLQMGERSSRIHVIGSPDVDVMLRGQRPCLLDVRDHYDIPWGEYGIIALHPVATMAANLNGSLAAMMDRAAVDSGRKWVWVYPNSDPGSKEMLAELPRSSGCIRVIPSLRFESMLTLLEHAQLLVGNSSMGFHEAPVYGTPVIDLGTRQEGREGNPYALRLPRPNVDAVANAIREHWGQRHDCLRHRGDGKSAQRFVAALPQAMSVDIQKRFRDRRVA